MVYLGAKLHNLFPSHNASYLEVANRTWNWIQKHSLIDPTTHLLADSLSLSTCKSGGGAGWTYQQGVLVGGLAELAVGMPASSNRFTDQAIQLVEGVKTHMTRDGVLMERCDDKTGADACNADARMYKGLFVRNVRYLIDNLARHQGNAALIRNYTQWLTVNAKALTNSSCIPEPEQGGGETCHIWWLFGKSLNNHSIGPLYGSSWGAVFTQGTADSQVSALDLFAALIPDGTRCINSAACSWNPAPPAVPPVAFSCYDQSVCPAGGYSCCFSNNQGVPECCNPNQHCNTTAMECQAGARAHSHLHLPQH